MNKDQLQSIIRALIYMVIGLLVKRGLIDSTSISESGIELVSASVGSVLLQWWSNRHRANIKDAAANTAVEATKAAIAPIVNQTAIPMNAEIINKQISDTQIFTKDMIK
jgi:fumarate reductase subunit D